jgi:hypothetical protein
MQVDFELYAHVYGQQEAEVQPIWAGELTVHNLT